MGLVERLLVEEARVLPLEDLRPQVASDGEVALVAQDGRHDQHRAGDRKAHQPDAAQRPDDEQQRIPGQERHHHHTGLDEHDREEQRVHPRPVGDDEGLEVLVDVEDEVDEKVHDFHGADYAQPGFPRRRPAGTQNLE